jgi:hypothetical protein
MDVGNNSIDNRWTRFAGGNSSMKPECGNCKNSVAVWNDGMLTDAALDEYRTALEAQTGRMRPALSQLSGKGDP